MFIKAHHGHWLKFLLQSPRPKVCLGLYFSFRTKSVDLRYRARRCLKGFSVLMCPIPLSIKKRCSQGWHLFQIIPVVGNAGYLPTRPCFSASLSPPLNAYRVKGWKLCCNPVTIITLSSLRWPENVSKCDGLFNHFLESLWNEKCSKNSCLFS